MIAVLDACALIAFLRKETGSEVVRGLLRDPNNTCLAHAVNLCEVYYDVIRDAGEARAQTAIGDLQTIGVIVREDLDIAFWQDAGRYKVANKVSLADAFAIALTNRVGGELVTSDHKEFDPIASNGVCPVRFFR